MIRIVLLIMWLAIGFTPAAAAAQESPSPPAAKSRNKSAPTKAPAKPKPKRVRMKGKSSKSAPARPATPDKPATQTTEKTPSPPPATGGRAPSVDAAALSADADEAVRKEGGSEIKTVEFGGLDIEGQLKSPQMLYFLNRLRAEFSRPELPHRSFIPELQRGAKESAF